MKDVSHSLEGRSVSVSYNVFDFAQGSVFLEVGKTKLLCSVTVQNGVPAFLRGQGSGWLTAEYSLLPAATHMRTPREASQMKRNGRSVEISRFVGRVLRSTVALERFPDKTIFIDCDVVQADGGTRTASITAASLALAVAQDKLLSNKIISQPFIIDKAVGISVGYCHNKLILDPTYEDDSKGIADFNFALAKSGQIIEVQGGAEKEPVPWSIFLQACDLARAHADKLWTILDSTRPAQACEPHKSREFIMRKKDVPLFSLMNRLAS